MPATSYSFLFITRSAGAVLGALLYKILQHYGLASNHHKILGGASIMFFLALLMFQFWHSLAGTGVLIGSYAGLCFAYGTALNCTMLMIPSKENIFFWLSISNGTFGIGSLLAPLIVDLFQLYSYTFYAVLVIPVIVTYFCFLKTPQEKQN